MNVIQKLRTVFKRLNYRAPDGPRDPNNGIRTTVQTNNIFTGILNQGSGYGPYNMGNLQDDLLSRYADYEDMDEFAECSNAIDIFADESCQTDQVTKKIVHTSCQDEKVARILEDGFHKNIRIDEKVWEMTRTLVKYGNNFEEHVISDQGLIDLKFLPPPQMRRIDNLVGDLEGFIFSRDGSFSISTEEFASRISDRQANDAKYVQSGFSSNVLEDWEVTHFRFRSKQREAPYGYSILDAARTIYKRLQMLEDAAVLYKLTRANQRFAFNIDVGDVPPNEVMEYLKQVKNSIKKQSYINPSTGKVDLNNQIIGATEDFFIPTRKDKPAMTIDTVGGFESGYYMDDLNYFKDKLYGAIKVPKDYLNYTEDSVSKANLSSMDIRFARTILRVQNTMNTGFYNMGRVHLACHGYDPDLIDFSVYMTAPSTIFEQTLMEVNSLKLDIAEKYRAWVDDHWIMQNILKFSEDEIKAIQERLKKQKEQENPFSENRFPTLESKRPIREMNKEVKKILEGVGAEAFANVLSKDKVIGSKLHELKLLAVEIKQSLKPRR